MAELIDVTEEARALFGVPYQAAVTGLNKLLARHTRWLADWLDAWERGEFCWTGEKCGQSASCTCNATATDKLRAIADKLERGEGV